MWAVLNNSGIVDIVDVYLTAVVGSKELDFIVGEQRGRRYLNDNRTICIISHDYGTIPVDNTRLCGAIFNRKNLGSNCISRGDSRDKRGRIEHFSGLCLVIYHVATISEVYSLPVLS